jgi:hypothetical protein
MAANERDDDRTRTATFGQAMRAVFWSFFGVRRGSDQARDAAQLRPVHVIVAALLGVAIFVGILIAIVHTVVK